ncbi:MAG: hypothetical protein KDB22_03480 [Planctomycetales bacterium]|nr:hypothetical protein [Planctomycetales bacterium]
MCVPSRARFRFQQDSREYQPLDRPGVVLVCVLACLATVVALAATTVNVALTGVRETKRLHTVRQMEAIIEGGCIRALAQLELSAEYEGELWFIPEDVLNGQPSRVEITVASIGLAASSPSASDAPSAAEVSSPPDYASVRATPSGNFRVSVIATLGTEDMPNTLRRVRQFDVRR